MPRKEQRVWNKFSIIYDLIMKKDQIAYDNIINRIKQTLTAEENVLEIATGTGFIAFGVREGIKHIEAVDFSPDMIVKAKKKASQMEVSNVCFSVQDAYNLQYDANSFDVVIISNTLHIMPQPEKALKEIKRVLKPSGRVIAPTFIHAGSKKAARLSKLASITGFRAYHKWTQQSYHLFLKENGFNVMESHVIKASFPIDYVVLNL